MKPPSVCSKTSSVTWPDEPVEACPPTAIYRFRKFARRNRGPVLAATLVLLALLSGAVVSAWQAIRAYHAEQNARLATDSERRANQSETAQRKQAEAVSRFLVSAFRSPNPDNDGRTITIAEVLDRSVKDVHDKFADDPRTKIRADGGHQRVLRLFGPVSHSDSTFGGNARVSAGVLGGDHRDSLATMSALAWAYYNAGRVTEAITLAQQTLKLQRAKLGIDDPATLASMKALASIYSSPGVARFDEAIALYEHAVKLMKAKLGPDDRDTLTTMDNLASCYDHAGLTAAAILLDEETLNRMKISVGPDDLKTLMVMHNLATFYSRSRRQEDALRLSMEALPLLETSSKLYKTRLGLDHPITLGILSDLAKAYYVVGRTDEALQQFAEVVKMRQARLGPDHTDTIATMGELRYMLSAQSWCQPH